MLTDSSPVYANAFLPAAGSGKTTHYKRRRGSPLFRAAATLLFKRSFVFSVIALSSLLYPYFFYWYLHTACQVTHAIFHPNIPPGPGEWFLFACVTSAGFKIVFPHGQRRAVSVPAPACAFCPDTYSADGCAGADVSNIRHRLPITLCTSIGLSLCHCARLCSKALCEFISVLCRFRQQFLRFAQSLGTPFPRCTAFSQLVFCPGRRGSVHSDTSDACAASAKAVPRILHPRHGLSRLRKHFASLYLANPVSMLRSTFKPVRGCRFVEERRRLIRVQLSERVFRKMIFLLCGPFTKTFLPASSRGKKYPSQLQLYRPGTVHMHPRAPPRRYSVRSAVCVSSSGYSSSRAASSSRFAPYTACCAPRGPVDPVPRQTPVPNPARDSLLCKCAARYFSDAGTPLYYCAAAGPVPAGCPGTGQHCFAKLPPRAVCSLHLRLASTSLIILSTMDFTARGDTSILEPPLSVPHLFRQPFQRDSQKPASLQAHPASRLPPLYDVR